MTSVGTVLLNVLESELGGATASGGAAAIQVVSRFPRYQRTAGALPAQERAKIHAAANLILNRFEAPSGDLLGVRLVGHADRDTPRRPPFEHRIALARAHEVQRVLARAIDDLAAARDGRPALPPYSKRLVWDMQSKGATQLVVANARTEGDRSRNRRVEIALLVRQRSAPRFSYVRGTVAGSTPATLSPRFESIITEFLKRAPNDSKRRFDKWSGTQVADRSNCVQSVSNKAIQLCQTANAKDRGDAPCAGPLTITGSRCQAAISGAVILSGRDYRAPVQSPIRCCDFNSPCDKTGTQDCVVCRPELAAGHYLVLQYKASALAATVTKLKCMLDRGCAVPVGVLSGVCDDKADVTCPAKTQRWRDCWEHWLLVLGYENNTFLFWDSAGDSAHGPRQLAPQNDRHYFGLLFYDSTDNRLSTAIPDDPWTDGLKVSWSGYHTGGFLPAYTKQKRYQVVSMHTGLTWGPDVRGKVC